MWPIKRFAPIVPLLLVGAALLTCTSTSVAATRVSGGSVIRVQTAPWAVFIRQAVPGGSLSCSGSILDSLHILTAAHCVYDRNGALASITSLSIKAGVSNYIAAQEGDVEQNKLVSSLRVHPGYVHSAGASPDDVAVLALSDPLDLSGPSATAVALPAAGAAYPADADLGIAGFGRKGPISPADGTLNWLTVKVDAQGSCGGRSNPVISDANAIAFCAVSPIGAACPGDSGSGLVTTTTGARTVIGIASAIIGATTGPTSCGAGTPTILTYVGAPEILRFIQGEDQPPIAPRKTSDTFLDMSWRGALRVRNTLTCASGNWEGAPTLTYVFIESETGRVLQQGPKDTYVLKAADVGGTVRCKGVATNAGGTAVLSSGSTKEIESAPAIGIVPLAPVAAVQGKAVMVRVVLYTPPGLFGKFGVCITPVSNVGRRICASQQVEDGSYGARPFRLRLKIDPTAPRGTSRLTINAVAGGSSAQKAALVRVARR